MNFMYCSIMTLIEREWRRFFMERSRSLGALLQPLLFLLVFGAGLHDHFHLGENSVHYSEYFFPGILGLVVLFSSIYATLTLVEDKRCGLFRLLLIGPAGYVGAVIGKVTATFSLSFVQSLLFLPLALLLGLQMSISSLLLAITLLALSSFLFSLIGVAMAWVCPSSSAFHALMSVILLPMWLLSGAMFPVENGVFSLLASVNPMAYVVRGLRMSLLEHNVEIWPMLGSLFLFMIGAALLLMAATKFRPLE